MGKRYIGSNSGPGPQRIKVVTNRGQYALPHIPKHSPDGFQWGYGGSGPSDAALAILSDCIGFDEAQKYYQSFKFEFVATAGKELEIKEEDIKSWFKKHKKEMNQ